MDYSECKNFFTGRSVALVGNANSIFGKSQGDAIDSHDIVMRFNYGEIKQSKDQGSRTDVLGTADSRISWEFIEEKFSPGLVIWLSYKPPESLRAVSETPFFLTPVEVIAEMQAKTQPHKPSSGLKAAHLIMEKFGAGSVALYGFDFFGTRSFYHRIHWRFWRKRRMPHNGSLEREILQSMGVRIH